MSDELLKLRATLGPGRRGAMSDTKVSVVLIALMLAFALGYICGDHDGRLTAREDGIAAGYAHYYLDENNQKQFHWGPKP